MYKPSNLRYKDMAYCACGSSGLKLPTLSLGLWYNFGEQASVEKMKQLIFTVFDLGIIAFSPLAQGMLTDRYLKGIPEDSRIKTDGRFLKEDTLNSRLEQIASLNEIARKWGQSLTQMALAWVLKDGQITSVLIGASKPEQILDNLKALENCRFSTEELEKIDAVSIECRGK